MYSLAKYNVYPKKKKKRYEESHDPRREHSINRAALKQHELFNLNSATKVEFCLLKWTAVIGS